MKLEIVATRINLMLKGTYLPCLRQYLDPQDRLIMIKSHHARRL